MNVKETGMVNRMALSLVFFVVLIAATPVSVPAQDNPDEGSEWTYSISPYMWMLSLDGDVTVDGTKSDLDVDFSDIWDELDLAGMIEAEAWKDRFGFLVSACMRISVIRQK